MNHIRKTGFIHTDPDSSVVRVSASGVVGLRLCCAIPTVKGITSTSYFSAHFKTTTFGVMDRKFLCSGEVLDLADSTDKAK